MYAATKTSILANFFSLSSSSLACNLYYDLVALGAGHICRGGEELGCQCLLLGVAFLATYTHHTILSGTCAFSPHIFPCVANPDPNLLARSRSDQIVQVRIRSKNVKKIKNKYNKIF